MKKLILTATAFAALLGPGAARANNFVDDWMNDTVSNYSGPSYFEGQKRSYLSPGQLSLRYPMRNPEYLATFTPPRFRAGCGGIDAFGGGFAMMNFDYLVDKFKRIISAAPAFAFQYALSQVSEDTKNIVNSLEAASNMLNQIQLDECKASKAIATYAVDATRGDDANFSKMVSEMDIASGVTESWNQVTKAYKSNPNQEVGAAKAAETMTGCSADINDLVNDGSFLKYAGNQYGYPPQIQNLLRGFIGDVVWKNNAGKWDARYLHACGGKNNQTFEPFVDGQSLYNDSLDSANNCKPLTDGSSVKSFVSNNLTGIYGKMMSKSGALSASEEGLIKTIPLPIYDYLKQLYTLNAPTNSLDSLKDPAAYGFGYNLLKNLFYESERMAFSINQQFIACSKRETETNKCWVCSADNASFQANLDEWRKSLKSKLADADQQWSEKNRQVAEMNNQIIALRGYQKASLRSRLLQRGASSN
jgi:conjugative transfer pilus assembly protein TraH